MKKYIAPEMQEIMFDVADIIQSSDIVVAETPKIFDGAIKLGEETIDIFKK